MLDCFIQAVGRMACGRVLCFLVAGMGVFKLLTGKRSPEIYQPNGGNALYVCKLPEGG